MPEDVEKQLGVILGLAIMVIVIIVALGFGKYILTTLENQGNITGLTSMYSNVEPMFTTMLVLVVIAGIIVVIAFILKKLLSLRKVE